MWRCLVLAGLLSLAACASANETQPLSPILIRNRLAGRTVMVIDNGQESLVQFGRNGRASVRGVTAEFARWSADPAAGLCLTWHEGTRSCGLVYQTSPSRFRWGDREMSVLDIGPDFGAGRFGFGAFEPRHRFGR